MLRFDTSPRRAMPKGHNLHLPHSITSSWPPTATPLCVRGTRLFISLPVWICSNASVRSSGFLRRAFRSHVAGACRALDAPGDDALGPDADPRVAAAHRLGGPAD